MFGYYKAVCSGDLEAIKHLEQSGADLNEYSALLHVAALKGRLDTVEYLIEGKADVNAQEDEGHGRLAQSTPLHLASFNGHLDIVKYLLDNGADFSMLDGSSGTPLSCASDEGHLKVVKYLFEKGAKIDERNIYGETPLFSSHLEVVKYLLQQGADINARNVDGKTFLLYASNELLYVSNEDWLEVVGFLLKYYYDNNIALKQADIAEVCNNILDLYENSPEEEIDPELEQQNILCFKITRFIAQKLGVQDVKELFSPEVEEEISFEDQVKIFTEAFKKYEETVDPDFGLNEEEWYLFDVSVEEEGQVSAPVGDDGGF